MKTLLTTALLLTAFAGFGQGTLTVEVTNFKTTDGYAYLQLFDHEDNFLDKAIQQDMIEQFDTNSVVFVLSDLPYGTYAVSVMHDENQNGEMDSGAFGIPKEGYGFSNNAKGMFGPPSFDDSKFTFSKDTSLKIDLIHPPF